MRDDNLSQESIAQAPPASRRLAFFRLDRDLRTRILFRAHFFNLQAPMGILLPFFVLHLREGLGFSDQQVAYVMGMSGISVLLFHQFWGYLADILPSRRNLLSVTVLAGGMLFWWLGGLKSFGAMLAGAFLFNTIFTPTIQLLQGYALAQEGGDRRFGYYRAYASISFIAANIIVGRIADSVYGGNLQFIFPAFAAVTVIASALLLTTPEERKLKQARPSFLEAQRHFLQRPEVCVFLLVAFLHYAAHGISYTLLAPLLSSLGADRLTVGMSYSIGAILELPVFFAAHKLRARFGDIKLLAFASGVQALRWIFVWRAETAGEILIIQVSHAITFGVFFAAAIGYINGHSGMRLKATAQTLFGVVTSGLASVCSNYIGSAVTAGGGLEGPMRRMVVNVLGLTDRGPLRNMYIGCSAVAALAFVFALVLLHVEKRYRAVPLP